jgi:hypothetical protein
VFTEPLFINRRHFLLTLPMDYYLNEVGGLVPLRCEEGGPKAVRDKVAGKASKNY